MRNERETRPLTTLPEELVTPGGRLRPNEVEQCGGGGAEGKLGLGGLDLTQDQSGVGALGQGGGVDGLKQGKMDDDKYDRGGLAMKRRV